MLARLSESEAAVERTRLMGSLAGSGLIEIVLRVEAERAGEVVERLLEFQIDGDHLVEVSDGTRRITVRGTADRIDLLSDGTFRLFDYKSGRAPDRASSLQLPVYVLRATDRLSGRRGRSWTLGEAAYIAFKGDNVRSMVPQGHELDDVLAEAQTRLLHSVEGIERGQFPVDPLDLFKCSYCAYSAVCRKDYVGDD
jgi:ATP-dependent helicase/DNAse subunit B